jgi:hypothetical protein
MMDEITHETLATNKEPKHPRVLIKAGHSKSAD